MPFNKISDVLGTEARKRGIFAKVSDSMVFEFFNGIARGRIGDDAMISVRPLYVQSSILTVAVLVPAFAQELKLHEPEIVQTINEKAGHEVVTGLRFLS